MNYLKSVCEVFKSVIVSGSSKFVLFFVCCVSPTTPNRAVRDDCERSVQAMRQKMEGISDDVYGYLCDQH